MADKKNTAPLKRKVISIETKIQILNRLDNGQTAILTIKKNETVKYDVHEALGHLYLQNLPVEHVHQFWRKWKEHLTFGLTK